MNQSFVFYPSTTQKASFTSSSGAISNAVGAYVNVVRLIATQDCYVAFGGTPTATTSDMFLKANTPEYFRIHPGQKAAAIRVSADGDLYVTEMTQ